MRNKKPLMIAVMALGAFACDDQNAGSRTAPTPGPAATTESTSTGPATDAVAANAQLVRLKLPGMV